VALQLTVLSLGMAATGLAAGGQTPTQAVRNVAARIHWRVHEHRAMELLQMQLHRHRHRRKLSRRQQNKMIAMGMLAKYGWSTGREFPCLVRLWNRESSWNHHAANPSGAYGIPQALPGSKMRSAGSDWRTNPETQIRWGLRYIKYRYGSPCHAWAHSMATGWY
jgi:hypothetical protein